MLTLRTPIGEDCMNHGVPDQEAYEASGKEDQEEIAPAIAARYRTTHQRCQTRE